MDGVNQPDPSKMLNRILGQIIYVRALAFGDILPDQIERLVKQIGIPSSKEEWTYPQKITRPTGLSRWDFQVEPAQSHNLPS